MTMKAPMVMLRRRLRPLKVPRLMPRHRKQETCRKRLQVCCRRCCSGWPSLAQHLGFGHLPWLRDALELVFWSAMLASFLPHAEVLFDRYRVVG